MMNFPKIDFQKNKKESLILVALISLITLVVYVNFLLIPQVTGVFGLLEKFAKLEYETKGVKSDVANIEKFSADLADLNEKVDSYENMLPAEQEVPGLLEGLSKMAQGSGVKIVGIVPIVPKEEKRPQQKQQKQKQQRQQGRVYQEIPILITAKSGYHELGKFIGELENSDRFMRVADISIKANVSSPKRHDVELLVLTYVLPKSK